MVRGENRAFVRDVIVAHNEIWVAEDAGAAVAFLGLDGETVRHLYVQPNHQNHGLGTALIEHAKALRPGGLRLSVLQANASARRFYERHGFTLDELRDGSTRRKASPKPCIPGGHGRAVGPYRPKLHACRPGPKGRFSSRTAAKSPSASSARRRGWDTRRSRSPRRTTGGRSTRASPSEVERGGVVPRP